MASDTGSKEKEVLRLIEFNLKHGTLRQQRIARELLLRFLEGNRIDALLKEMTE